MLWCEYSTTHMRKWYDAFAVKHDALESHKLGVECYLSNSRESSDDRVGTTRLLASTVSLVIQRCVPDSRGRPIKVRMGPLHITQLNFFFLDLPRPKVHN